MNVEKSNFIPIRIKNYFIYIYIYIYCVSKQLIISNVSYVVSLLTNNDFSKAKYALIVDDHKTCWTKFPGKRLTTVSERPTFMLISLQDDCLPTTKFPYSILRVELPFYLYFWCITLLVLDVTQFVLPLWPTRFLVYIIDLLPKNNNNNNQECLCVWQNMD